MPQKILCNDCGETLYTGLELEPPTEIVQKYNGECPKCRRKLSFDPEKVKIISTEEGS